MQKNKVRRRVLACARCRKRKLACDFKVPDCTRCVAAGVRCVGFDSSTASTLPYRSIADHLEAHIARLEGAQSPPSSRRFGQPSPATSFASDALPSHQGAEKCAFADSLVNQAMEDITPPFLGVSKARPILQCVVKGTQLPSRKGPVGSTDLDENHPRSIINPPTISLFRDLIADENGAKVLFENYLERIITQYPIYHRTDVTKAFTSIYPQKASKSGEDCIRDQYIVCMIMAISLSTHARKNVVKANQQAFQLVRCAMQWIPKVATNDIAGLQAILLLTQYIFLNPSMADLWLLTALISQSVIDLGLHQELPIDAQISDYDRDMRRRLFWCAWEMEVGVCSIFLFPTSLPIKGIKVKFPLEIDDTAITQHGTVPEGRVSKFTQRIICSFRLIEAELVSVMWHDEPTPEEFDSIEVWAQNCVDRIQQWQREIYAAARANQDPGLLARWEEMMLYSDIAVPYVYFMLNRPSKRLPVPTTEQRMIAMTHAVKIAAGYFKQSEAAPGRIKYVFHPCHHVFHCAIVFVEGLTYCKQEVLATYLWEQVEQSMNVFAECFRSISERWTAATRCLEEYERSLAPVKKEYMDLYASKASIKVLTVPQAINPATCSSGVHDELGHVRTDMGGLSYWNMFNPTATSEPIEPLTPYAHTATPRDWNTEFQLYPSIERMYEMETQ
ncbi:fungal specific transcription factor [Stagonosporopsis vannaccii]|nr:fungal specific transcription factor [Stagonosporopsis vannaccii]